jgi:hypothetical protein
MFYHTKRCNIPEDGSLRGRTMGQALSCQDLIAYVWVRACLSPCAVYREM